ncbi:MAG: hypothetical protein ACO3JL_20050, partial [Myxococcota bacterium]
AAGLFSRYPELCLSVPAFTLEDVASIGDLSERGACVIAFAGVERVTPDIFQRLHQANISVQVGTFATLDERAGSDGPGIYDGLLDAGVDVLATDDPDQVAEALRRRRISP